MALETGDRQRATAQTDNVSDAKKTAVDIAKKIKTDGNLLSVGREQSVLRSNEKAANSQLHVNDSKSNRLKTTYRTSTLNVYEQFRENIGQESKGDGKFESKAVNVNVQTVKDEKKIKAFGDKLSVGNEHSVLHTDRETSHSQLHADAKSSRTRALYKTNTLKVNRQFSENVRRGEKGAEKIEAKIEKNFVQISKNEAKLNKMMKRRYYRNYQLKGGINSPLRIETSMKSKLRVSPMKQVAGYAVNKSQVGLDKINDAMDTDSLGIQNAWGVTAAKTFDSAKSVYRVSAQAKHFREMQKERKIAKVLRKETKLMKQTFRMEYRSAYSSYKKSPVGQASNFFEKKKYKKFLKKKYMKNAMKQYKQAKQAGQAVKATFSTGLSATDKIKDTIRSIIHIIRHSKTALIVVIAVFALMIVPVLGASFLQILTGGYETQQQETSNINVPAEVLQWREFVEQRCEANNDKSSATDMTKFVNAILATIWQESGGVPESCDGDIMQDKACGLWESSTFPANWSEAQKSIDVGVRYFYGGLKGWPVTDPEDFDGLQMVAQGYNYGFGFWNYNGIEKGKTKWSLELSQAFSNSKGGKYGHPPYGQEWLEKYQAILGGGGTGSGKVVVKKGVEGVVQTALNQEGITESGGDNNVVFNTDYYGHEVHDGQPNADSAYPWCCSFVWWCFEMSGNGNLVKKTAGCKDMQDTIGSYGGTVYTSNISSKAKRGDLVIYRGGAHIGIVVENKGNGNLITIEGNTTAEGSAGDEYNGGCVAIKYRNVSTSNITALLQPNY